MGSAPYHTTIPAPNLLLRFSPPLLDFRRLLLNFSFAFDIPQHRSPDMFAPPTAISPIKISPTLYSLVSRVLTYSSRPHSREPTASTLLLVPFLFSFLLPIFLFRCSKRPCSQWIQAGDGDWAPRCSWNQLLQPASHFSRHHQVFPLRHLPEITGFNKSWAQYPCVFVKQVDSLCRRPRSTEFPSLPVRRPSFPFPALLLRPARSYLRRFLPTQGLEN